MQDTKSVDVHASSKSTLNLSIEGYGVPALLFSKNSYLSVFWGLSHISVAKTPNLMIFLHLLSWVW